MSENRTEIQAAGRRRHDDGWRSCPKVENWREQTRQKRVTRSSHLGKSVPILT